MSSPSDRTVLNLLNERGGLSLSMVSGILEITGGQAHQLMSQLYYNKEVSGDTPRIDEEVYWHSTGKAPEGDNFHDYQVEPVVPVVKLNSGTVTAVLDVSSAGKLYTYVIAECHTGHLLDDTATRLTYWADFVHGDQNSMEWRFPKQQPYTGPFFVRTLEASGFYDGYAGMEQPGLEFLKYCFSYNSLKNVRGYWPGAANREAHSYPVGIRFLTGLSGRIPRPLMPVYEIGVGFYSVIAGNPVTRQCPDLLDMASRKHGERAEEWDNDPELDYSHLALVQILNSGEFVTPGFTPLERGELMRLEKMREKYCPVKANARFTKYGEMMEEEFLKKVGARPVNSNYYHIIIGGLPMTEEVLSNTLKKLGIESPLPLIVRQMKNGNGHDLSGKPVPTALQALLAMADDNLRELAEKGTVPKCVVRENSRTLIPEITLAQMCALHKYLRGILVPVPFLSREQVIVMDTAVGQRFSYGW